MMDLAAGENVRIYIQHGERLWDLKGLLTSTSLSIHNEGTFELDLQVIGDEALVTTADNFAPKAEAMHTAIEWRCDYCGQINERKDKHCTICGGRRNFLYG